MEIKYNSTMSEGNVYKYVNLLIMDVLDWQVGTVHTGGTVIKYKELCSKAAPTAPSKQVV